MCRSIKTLRPPYSEIVTEADMQAAARQYVRKISGFHRPAAHNEAVFEKAIEEIADTTERLLQALVVRGNAASPAA